MLDYLQKRKDELRMKAQQYGESVRLEYSGAVKGGSSFSGVGLIGSGIILAVFLAIKYLGSDDEKAGRSEKQAVEGMSKIGDEIQRGQRDEFREKLIMVSLEMLRQLLLTVINKINPSNDKAGI